jgi:uncharacterized protein YgbK (DUF1537 family)
MVVGNVVATTAEQLRELYRAYDVTTAYLDPARLIAGGADRETAIQEAVATLTAAPADIEFLCLTTNCLDPTACARFLRDELASQAVVRAQSGELS